MLDTDRLGVKSGDKAFFCAGGIDVRCDIHNQVQNGENEAELIEALVNRYLNVLGENDRDGVEFWLVAVLPTAHSNLLPDHIRNDPLFPYTGLDGDIARYIVTMNRELQQQGQARGYRYLDIHRRYVDEFGLLRPELGAYMHVNQNGPILAEMCDCGLYDDRDIQTTPNLAAMLQAMRGEPCRKTA